MQALSYLYLAIFKRAGQKLSPQHLFLLFQKQLNYSKDTIFILYLSSHFSTGIDFYGLKMRCK